MRQPVFVSLLSYFASRYGEITGHGTNDYICSRLQRDFDL